MQFLLKLESYISLVISLVSLDCNHLIDDDIKII